MSQANEAETIVARHELLPDGESTARWAIRGPAFRGSVQRLTHCGRCGESLPFKRMDEPRNHIRTPVLHFLCDPCYEALPE